MPYTQQNLSELQSEEQMLVQILEAKGLLPPAGARVLDIGCGAGDLMRNLLARGYDAYGTDLDPNWETGDSRNSRPTPTTGLQDRLRLLTLQPYRLPYNDASFDLCVSIQVLEHVLDYNAFMRELLRVLKPGGTSLHLFPSRWRFLESHIGVPLAGVFQHRAYLKFWAVAGIRNRFQQGLAASEVLELNQDYLQRFTTYHPVDEISSIVASEGLRPEFVPEEYTRFHHSRWVRLLRMIPLPGIAALFCRFTQLALLIHRD